MKSLVQFIQEKLIIKKSKYNYFPETKKELQDIILQRIEQDGNEVDLNDIDTSNVTDMSELFKNLIDFNGNISSWDVSKVTNMSSMFVGCEAFNQDISNWDVSNVTDMKYMFYNCKKFNQDISIWDVSKLNNKKKMFDKCPIKEKYKPKFSI